MVRPVTQHLIDSFMLDSWPRPAAICDFGLDSQEHYEALYYPVLREEITPEQLDEALGDGKKLTALVAKAPSNPHKNIIFHTSWDDLGPEDEGEDENG